MQSFTADVQVDDASGDGVVQIPEDFAKAQDWRPGDRLVYKILDDGGVAVENVDKKERQAEMRLFIVEELVIHRVRHAIRAKRAQDAMDMVVAGDSNEFDQNHVGSNVLGARAVTVGEFLESFDSPAEPERKKDYIQIFDYEAGALVGAPGLAF